MGGRTGYDVRGSGMGVHIFKKKKCGTHLETVGDRRVTCSGFRTYDPRVADATVKCSRPGFVLTGLAISGYCPVLDCYEHVL